MKAQPLIVALTCVNVAAVSLTLLRPRQIAEARDLPPVLRAQALEIVDNHGRVRAEIKVVPAQPDLKMGDGTVGYPEAVQFRLISSQGAPNVKLIATEDGSGQVLGGQSSYVQILARGSDPSMKILNKDGRQQVWSATPQFNH